MQFYNFHDLFVKNTNTKDIRALLEIRAEIHFGTDGIKS